MSVEQSHLHLVDTTTGEASPQCPDCLNAERALRRERAVVAKLEKKLAGERAAEPEVKDVREVLEFWRDHCMPRAKIVVGHKRWKAVRDRLHDVDVNGEPAYTVLKLKAAVIGVLLSDFHVENKAKGYLDASSIFQDSKNVDDHIFRATGFRQRKGVSALTLLDELGATVFDHLSLRCSCEHLWIDHVRAFPRHDGLQPCAECSCSSFDYFAAKQDRWLREQGAA